MLHLGVHNSNLEESPVFRGRFLAPLSAVRSPIDGRLLEARNSCFQGIRATIGSFSPSTPT